MKAKQLLTRADYLNFEIKFLASLSIVSAIACLITIISNIVNNLDWLVNVLVGLLGLSFVGFYYWAKLGKKVFTLKIFYTVITLVILNLLWRYNNGSHGPSPYLFIILFGVLTFIWSGRELLVVTFVFLLNILFVFYFDYTYPDFIPNYPTDLDRISDVYAGVLIFGGVIFYLMTNAKKNLMMQYIEAKRSDMLKSAFLANMSHEIRTPMNAIFGFSQVLKDSDFTEEEKKSYIDLICNQTDYLLSIISELIDISKIESGVLTINDNVVNLNELISNMPASLHHLKKEGVEIKLVLDDNIRDLNILIDSTRLKQVINNLTSNALKFTFKGYVELGCQVLDNGFIQIYVKDTGIGIAPNNAVKIFDRFYQIESKNKTVLNEGTGLGLSIASALVKRMGGDIWVESIENEGSVFFFTIPNRPGNADAKDKRIPKIQHDLDFKGCSVLVVDDQKNNYLLLKETLSAISCKSAWSANGKDAVKFIKNNKNVGLIIMDAEMPAMDGYTATQLIKKISPSVPVIMQSLFISEEKLSKMKEVGAADFIAKPVLIGQLKEMLKKYFAEK